MLEKVYTNGTSLLLHFSESFESLNSTFGLYESHTIEVLTDEINLIDSLLMHFNIMF